MLIYLLFIVLVLVCHGCQPHYCVTIRFAVIVNIPLGRNFSADVRVKNNPSVVFLTLFERLV